MNALTRAATMTIPRASAQLTVGRRMASSSTSSTSSGFSGFRKDWLSDPSTYPIIGILGVAVIGAFGFIGYKFATHPNVRVTSKTKGQVLRTW